MSNQTSQTVAALNGEHFITSWMASTGLPVVPGRIILKAKILLQKLKGLIAPETDADKKHIQNLSHVLHALADKQQQLIEQLKKTEDDNARRSILLELDVIKRQREKGVEVYRTSKAGLKG